MKLTTGSDIAHLPELDLKLWVALACPTGGVELDKRTLDLMDGDHDGRIRAPELLAATKFACHHLRNPDDLLKGASALPLSAINDAHPEGKALLAAARRILELLGKKDATAITVADVEDPAKIFGGSPFNGDGVVTAESAEEEDTKLLIANIVECVGSVADRSGTQGVDQEKVDLFFTEARAFADWWGRGERGGPRMFPLKPPATSAAATAVAAVRIKVDDFFGRCRLAAYDPRTVAALNRKEEEYLALAAGDMSITAVEVAGFPLALVAPGKSVPLSGAVNPAHAAAMATFRDQAVVPLLGERSELAEADWLQIQEKVSAFEVWKASKLGEKVEKLGIARVRALLESDAKARVDALIARDKALVDESSHMDQVQRLVLYHRDLVLLCTNFVNFRDFYDGGDYAIFQAGMLYLDQRSCSLCMRVTDPGKHAALSGFAGAYLVYADCQRAGSGETMQIVAAFTDGDSDNLMVGRNGVFVDRKGQDWDATISRIVDNPISVRQAFFAPYKKFLRLLEEQVAKRAAAADAESQAGLSAAAQSTANVDKSEGAAAVAGAVPNKVDVGTVAAMGVAIGAIGAFLTALAGYVTGVFDMGPLAVLQAVVLVLALISGPSMILAYMTLRKRNLAPLLDANGWAINARAKVNVPFGRSLTLMPTLPQGAKRDLVDPYAEKGFPWVRWAVVLGFLYVAWHWYEGEYDRRLPHAMRSTEVLGEWAPDPREGGATRDEDSSAPAAVAPVPPAVAVPVEAAAAPP